MSTALGVRVGIIGGSGLYQMPELTGVEEVKVDTPFGPPSDAFIVGTLEGERVAFLPRHGRGHRLTPTEVPFRANIYAMKKLGVESILSASAVGSLQEKYAPLDMVIPDQFFDRTRARVRESTFFGEGIVAHVSFAHPVCGRLGDVLEQSCKVADVKTHRNATYVCMEGPAFSTVAESNVYRSWGMDIIGMTNLQEAKLAREAEICYATLALVTDYDCWHEAHDAVSVEAVVEGKTNRIAFISYYKGEFGIHTIERKEPLHTASTSDFGAPGPIIDFQAPLQHTLVKENNRKKGTWEKMFLEGRPPINVGVTNNGDLFGGTQVSFGDVLGDKQINFYAASISQYRTLSLSYVNLARRFQWALQGYSQTQFFYGQLGGVFYDPSLTPFISRDSAIR